TDRLTAPEAIELVNTVEQSLSSGAVPQRWVGAIVKSDLRLAAPLVRTDLRRDGEPLPYQAIVFERVVKPSVQLGNSICPGTRRAAYFWRADGDGVVFFPQGSFDQDLVPPLRSCLHDLRHVGEGAEPPPVVTAVTPDQAMWVQESVEGDISPGLGTGACRFLEPEAERRLRDEHGITCELTTHRVSLAARLHGYAVGGSDSMRLDLDTTEIIGVRYTIDCDVATNKVSVPCFDTSRWPTPVDQPTPP
ncbi:MAG: hypothetical protein ACREX3_14645, partial [Gammaproteobacteria bacterium]